MIQRNGHELIETDRAVLCDAAAEFLRGPAGRFRLSGHSPADASPAASKGCSGTTGSARRTGASSAGDSGAPADGRTGSARRTGMFSASASTGKARATGTSPSAVAEEAASLRLTGTARATGIVLSSTASVRCTRMRAGEWTGCPLRST